MSTISARHHHIVGWLEAALGGAAGNTAMEYLAMLRTTVCRCCDVGALKRAMAASG